MGAKPNNNCWLRCFSYRWILFRPGGKLVTKTLFQRISLVKYDQIPTSLNSAVFFLNDNQKPMPEPPRCRCRWFVLLVKIWLIIRCPSMHGRVKLCWQYARCQRNPVTKFTDHLHLYPRKLINSSGWIHLDLLQGQNQDPKLHSWFGDL